jgi:hypothetical protein
MPLRLTLKNGIALAAMLAMGGLAQAVPFAGSVSTSSIYESAQYYSEPYGQRYRRGTDPRHACEQAGGDFYRIPSKHVRAIDMRQVGPNVYVVTVAIRGNTVNCTVDGSGNVLRFGNAY